MVTMLIIRIHKDNPLLCLWTKIRIHFVFLLVFIFSLACLSSPFSRMPNPVVTGWFRQVVETRNELHQQNDEG